MRVNSHIAMTGKMFCGSHYTCTLHTFHKLSTKQGYPVFILAKTSVVYYRVIGVVIYINIRGKIQLNAQAFTLFTYSIS